MVINNRKQEYILAFLVAILTILVRLPFLLADLNFNNDAQVYSDSMAMPFFSGQYNVQLPGYVLYIYLCRLFFFFIHNAVVVQNLVNLLLTGLISYSIFMLFRKIKFTLLECFMFTLLFSCLSVLLLGSLTGGSRLFHVLASVFLIYLAIRTGEEKKYLLLFSACFGFFMGFRQDLSFMLAPLYIYLFFIVKDWKTTFQSIILLLSICLLWFIPLVLEYGGIYKFIIRLFDQFSHAVLPTSILANGLAVTPILNIIRLLFDSFVCFALFIGIFIFSLVKKEYNFDRRLVVILALAFLPAFLFQLFIHNGNFVLLTAFITPLFIFLIYGFRLKTKKRAVVAVLLAGILCIQFFGIRMIHNPDYTGKIVNTLWLQWSYDGAKTAKLLRFNMID